MKVEAIDHLHFCVPDLGRAQALLGTFAGGECTHACGIATAQAAGLRLLTRGGNPDDRPEAEFDAADSWGMTVKLTERRRG